LLLEYFKQNVTQTGFIGVTVPQYMASGTSSRMPVVFRAVTGCLQHYTDTLLVGALSSDFEPPIQELEIHYY
jgi:hypothetical protein